MTTLYEQAEALLLQTRACLVQAGLDVPARQVIYPNPIPADCEQIVVIIASYSPQPPWEAGQVCPVDRWFGTFNVMITRKAPAPTARESIPPQASMLASAQTASADAEVLVCVVNSQTEIGPELLIETMAPQGGLQSTVLNIQLPVL